MWSQPYSQALASKTWMRVAEWTTTAAGRRVSNMPLLAEKW